jgi:hypothetical protein
MRKLNLYNFHKGIAPHRFDHHNTHMIIELLSDRYDVHIHHYNGQDKFYYENVLIDQGSILIFEFDDTKEFKTFDFGDAPTISVQLSHSKNFIGAAIGQYNKQLWDDQSLTAEVRRQVLPSIYPESCWNFGSINYDAVQEFRTHAELDKRLHWRGSIYKDHLRPEYRNVRYGLELLSTKLKPFHFGNYPIQYDAYIQEALMFKLALGYGGGGGYSCGDFCLRDMEMFGLGIPLLRPKYVVETHDPLIPDVHYISVDCEFDEVFRYKNPEALSDSIAKKYYEVIDNDEFLRYIVRNAHEWYLKNVSGPNISNLIINVLGL